MAITITLETHEAHMILDPIRDSALEDQKRAAKAKAEDAEWLGIRAQVRNRIATAIVDQLIPDEDPRMVILREEIELGML